MRSFCALLVFIFSLWSNAHSQDAQLKVYTDYGTCQHGLKDQQGKIVWPAEFDMLHTIWHGDYHHYPRNYFWSAQKNGFFGLLSDSGKELIPFAYNGFNIHYSVISASDNQAAYLFTLEGKLIKRFEGYSSIAPHAFGYIFQKDEKFGLLDPSYTEILPPYHDRINFAVIREWNEGVSRLVSNRFIEIENKGERGIFDVKTRKIIVPFTSESLHIYHSGPLDCEHSDAFFQAYDPKTNIERIINIDGVQVYRDQHFPQYFRHISITSDSCGSESTQLAYVEKDRKMRVLNIRTGKYSNEHEEIYPLQGYSVFFDNKKWGVIYPDFNETKAYPQPNYELDEYVDLETSYKLSIASERYSKLFTSIYSSEKIDSVLITQLIVETSKKNKKRLELYGLFNFRTGKHIKQKYHRIERRHLGNQTVYWAFIYGNPDDPYYKRMTEQLDVYSSDLSLLNRIENIDDVDFDHYRERRNYNVIIERDDLMGIVDAFGNEIAPIHYKEISIASLLNHHDGTDPHFFYHCSLPNEPDASNSRKGLLAKNGKTVIPFDYFNIYIQNNLIFAWRGKEDVDIFTISGEQFMMNVKSYTCDREVKKDAQCIGKSYNDPLLHTYIVKDKKLYHYFGGKLEQYGKASFDFPQKYCYFLEWIVIDQNANVISSEPVGLYPRRSYYSNDFVTDCSTFLNEYPTAKVEPIKRKPKELPPAPEVQKEPSYHWKAQRFPNQNRYYLYSPKGDLKYSAAFDFPTPTDSLTFKVFSQNGKYGRFDKYFNIDIEAKYDFISPDGRFARKNNLWHMRKGNSKEWSDGFQNISDDPYQKHHFVFVNGKIGLLNDSLEYILPLTDSAAFIQKFDLVKTLDLKIPSNNKRPTKIGEIIFNASPTDVYRRINNFQIVEEAYYESIANQKMHDYPVDSKFPDLPRDLLFLKLVSNETTIYRERAPTHYNQYYFSELTFTRILGDGVNYYQNLRPDADKALFNYKIVNNELIPIQLEDILKTDIQSTEQLNKLLIEKANAIQAFGENCVDIDSKLKELKSNFLIKTGSIGFYGRWNGNFDITITFNELRSLLLYPNKMRWTY